MKSLALVLLLAAPCAAAKSTATVESSEARLAADDPAGALADAEAAVVRGGGAAAYAARANAELALGRPLDAVVADYREAARLDPKKYEEKYEGLIVQKETEANPAKGTGGLEMTNLSDVMAKILLAVGVIALLLVVGEALIHARGGA